MTRSSFKSRRWALSVVAVATLSVAGSAAAVPEFMSYQGKLLDGQGAPVTDGPYSMEFRFYDSCAGGGLLLLDEHPEVTVRSGIYAVALGGGILTPGVESDLRAVFEHHGTVCLGIRVEDDEEMVPRQPILSAGYALRALVADDTLAGAVDAASDVIWTGRHEFTTDITFGNTYSIEWPHVSGDTPVETGYRITKFTGNPPGQSFHPNGELDEQFMVCYNCREGGTQREDETQHSWNQKIEANYWEEHFGREQLEVNWNYISPDGFRHRPFAFVLSVTGHCSTDDSVCTSDDECGGGSCDGSDQASFTWINEPVGVCINDHLVACRSPEDCGGSECLYLRKTVMDRDGKMWVWGGLNVPSIFAGAIEPSSNVSFKVDAKIEATDEGATVRGVFSKLDFNEVATADSALDAAIGVTSQVWLSGTAAGRDIAQEATAFSGSVLVTQTGGVGGDGQPPTIERAHGYVWRLVASGRNARIRESAGFVLQTPAVLDPVAPIDVERHYGIRVEDQLGFGSLAGDAMLVEAQSGGPSRGNFRLAGGSWNNGHIVFDTLHLWADRNEDLLRVKSGTPLSEDDGRPIHAPLGTDTSWGTIYWGDSSDSATDSGNEICALAGLACAETWDMGATSSRNCSTTTHATPRFMAFCH